MEAKPIEVIMRIDFAASTGTEIVAHAEKVQELIRCSECIYQQGDKRIPRDLNCYLDGRDAPEHGFCWLGKRREVEDDS